MKQLFRPHALSAHQAKWMGKIVLIRPTSFLYLTGLALGFALVIVSFLGLGSYTKRSTVTGQLVPDVGLIKVYVPQSGVILEKHVIEGQTVKQGDLLYLLSSERQSSTQGELQAAISRQVITREKSLRDELRHTEMLQKDEHAALSKKVSGLQAEQWNIGRQLAGQQSRMKLAEDAVQRAGQLLAQGYISKEMMQQKQADLLDQRNRLQALQRDQISIGRELQSQRIELTSLPLRQQNQRAQMERTLTSTGQELMESEAKRRLAITATGSGIITAVAAEVGQAVDGGKPLVSIVPIGALLQASLYASSKSIGFIKTGDPVLLRYQSYPYQKFGHANGTVASVSKTALPVGEFGGMATSLAGNGEPLYRVTVHLSRQTINAYGRPQPLQAGMLVEADILQETRKLYEWVLEPLYSLTGKL